MEQDVIAAELSATGAQELLAATSWPTSPTTLRTERRV